MFVSQLLILTSIVLFILYHIKSFIELLIIDHHLLKLPAPKKYNWVFGNFIKLTTDQVKIHKQLRKWARKYYPIYSLSATYKSAANLLLPEDFELLSTNMAHIKKGEMYLLLQSWLNTGLLTSEGEKWQQRRKILTSSFHFSILQEFVSIFNKDTDELITELENETTKQFTEINPFIADFTLKTIAETSMGTKMNFKTEKERNYRRDIHDVVNVFLQRLFRPWLYYRLTYFFSPLCYKEGRLVKSLHKFTTEVVKRRERELFEKRSDVTPRKKKMAMLDLLLQAKHNENLIDDEGIREEVDTFMFEGHDTVSTALCFTLMLLANHSDAQKLIIEEMEGILQGDLKKKPTYNDLQEMKYLERCIKESLRLYPSVYFIARQLGEDMKTHSGYLLKKNSMVVVHIYDIHHNPDIYPDPDKFDPDRFLPEVVAKRHPFAYVPFSAGPRNCIGQRYAILEMKSAICGILSNFVLEPVDTPDSIVLISDIILRTKNPIKIRFRKRI